MDVDRGGDTRSGAAAVAEELRRLQAEVERTFPDAWKFVRPGFDRVEQALEQGHIGEGRAPGRDREVVLKAPLQLETARLILIAPAADDAEAIYERYASDPEVTRYLGWPRHRSVAETRTFLAFSADQWRRWPGGPYLIRARPGGELLGGTGLAFERPDEAVTGYVLAKDAWGHGYATEALHAIVDVARLIGVRRLIASCHPQHRASSHVLEKCGFTRGASCSKPTEFPNLEPGVLQDVLCYERLFESSGQHAV